MERNTLKQRLEDKSTFIVCVELTSGPAYDFGPIEKFLAAYKTADGLVRPESFDFVGPSVIPDGFEFAGIALPQNPGGLANIQPADVISQLRSKDLLGRLDVPVIGNVYLLSTITPAPRLMHDINLPGCFVSDDLLAKLYSQHLCIGELIYQAAAAEKDGRERLRATINKPRNHALEHTSAILNYLFVRDHIMKNSLITIGESIHASIPKTGKIMKQLAELGPAAYSTASGPLNYIKALIESQASDGADYIAVNLDAFGEDDPQVAVDMMAEYVRLVRKWGHGVPICIDSSSNDVLTVGLKQWYETDQQVRPPLINSVKVYTMDQILPLRKDFDFAFIGLLVSEGLPSGPGGSHSVDELYSLAKQIFKAAVGQYGFRPREILFDSTVFPLAIDMPMEPNVPGYTYRAFETMKKIKSDPEMNGVHCSLGASNCVRDLPGRKIGVCRAYVAKAMEYGLDAAIVNVAHHYGQVEPAPELLELVDAYAKMDGSAERLNRAMELMGKFCRENRKPTR